MQYTVSSQPASGRTYVRTAAATAAALGLTCTNRAINHEQTDGHVDIV